MDFLKKANVHLYGIYISNVSDENFNDLECNENKFYKIESRWCTVKNQSDDVTNRVKSKYPNLPQQFNNILLYGRRKEWDYFGNTNELFCIHYLN